MGSTLDILSEVGFETFTSKPRNYLFVSVLLLSMEVLFDVAVKDISLSVLISVSFLLFTTWLFISGNIEMLYSLKYNLFAGIEVRNDSDCCAFVSKVGDILPNKDVGLNISIVSVTLKYFGVVIDDKSMLILDMFQV